jgi:hypothetical protein
MTFWSKLVSSPPSTASNLPKDNPALRALRSLPQTAVIAGLSGALPQLAQELRTQADKQAAELEIPRPDFADCILDLELVGAFERVLRFAGDPRLASLFVDAIVFEATKQSPRVPTQAQIIAGWTHQHRGIAKYALAQSVSRVPDPGLWLFGSEYARARGKPNNPFYTVAAGASVLYIRRVGVWVAEHALTGRLPTRQEIDALPQAIRLSESSEVNSPYG